MVTHFPGVSGEGRSDRAQLILVGAVAIAIIVLGLVVVFNTVLYTDNVAATGAVTEPGEAEEYTREIRRGSGQLAQRVNTKDRWITDTGPSSVRAALDENLSEYSVGFSNATSLSAGAIVTFRRSSSSVDEEYGSRVVYPESSDFQSTHAADSKHWSVLDGTGAMIADFDMVVDKSGLEGPNADEAFHIVWREEGSSSNHVLWIYEVSTGSGDKVAIRTVNDTGSPDTDFSGTECVVDGTQSESQVTFNFSDGDIRGFEDCSGQIDAWATNLSSSPGNVEFARADNASGRFSMVLNEKPDPGTNVSHWSVSTSAPFWTNAIWKFELDVNYQSESVTYEETVVVEVYNRSR